MPGFSKVDICKIKIHVKYTLAQAAKSDRKNFPYQRMIQSCKDKIVGFHVEKFSE